jgi:hypothetical protein
VKARSESAKNFLVYFYHRQTPVFLEICKEYLRVPSWFFHEVRISERDASFDVQKLAQQQDDIIDEVDYQQSVQFLLELLLECRIENAHHLGLINPHLLVFALIQNHRSEAIAGKVISGITNLAEAALMRATSFVSQKVEDWPVRTVLPFIPTTVSDYLLEGDSAVEISSRPGRHSRSSTHRATSCRRNRFQSSSERCIS